MIILQKNDPELPQNTTLLAEVIVESFGGTSIDQVLKLGGRSVPKALKLLADLKLITIEGDKIVLTKAGKDFLRLPYIESIGKAEGNTFDSS
ncbi:MAG: hypothetical protein R6U44_09320 [Archaeoglobaceae archaeon]